MEASVDKCLAFCQSLAMSGQKFSFTLSIGKDNFSFSNNKELDSSSCVKKKKSPSQIRREQRRKEKRILKANAGPTEKIVKASNSEETSSTVNVVEFQCMHCDSKFRPEEDLKAHIGVMHGSPVLPTPEKERAPDHIADLALTPIHGERGEEDILRSPPPLPVVCDMRRGILNPLDSPGIQNPWDPVCGKTFTSEADLRVHVHLSHFICSRERYPTPCPWEGCISHEVKQ